VTGGCFHLAELRRHSCAPRGSNPVSSGGKSPVPYLSGVTRWCGSGGNRTPSVDRRHAKKEIQPDCCAPWRDRPMVAGAGCGAGPDDDEFPMGLSRCWWPSWMPGALAGPEGVEPSTAGFGDRGATLARALRTTTCDCPRMTECADWGTGLATDPGGPATSSCRDCRVPPRGAGGPRSGSPRTQASLEEAIGRRGTRACRGRRGHRPAASAR
jgi:hypothetical protein